MSAHRLLSLGAALGAVASSGCRAPATLTPSAPDVVSVANAGLQGPENLVYDSAADVFLVSNVAGDGGTRDGNGFISRVAPDGRVLDLKWIAGGVRGATLDAPKGLAIRGDTLAVADLGGVHEFDRRTGAPLRTVALPGWMMNDVLFAPDGSMWVTDTGPDRTTTPPDTTRDVDAVWRVAPDGRVVAIARGLALGRPDGITRDGGGVLVTTFGANRLEHVGGAVPSRWDTARTLPAGRDDGLRRLPDGSLLVTSWDAKAVWRVALDGSVTPLLTGVTSPAGVALDTRRHRLAVTSMQGNALYLLPIR
ncbi:SMP-30/Gluconolaconase/LRE-like region-containing protein [Gemmatirosa kalamazoonensis]|uniref:SMP-30/Gluconolaconase/LRE-like region-containing protein n=1 Tax=Gemmatirosa kalamazoonensis TaxID=861299 RepID=W0REM7_9BACT|nr:SMP-30/gluconolactonase/LRE family protein [Gemmatirosa kalamazoonensis]AHG87833.1 SMP-30/Gluconolaconase/LRE-like region-containing protein [Gemmatirosa kalamazoonensis]